MADFIPTVPITLQIRKVIFEKFNDVEINFTNRSHETCNGFAVSRIANGKCAACGVNDLDGAFWCTGCGTLGFNAKHVGYPDPQ